jgi:hypothetical protein
LKIWSLRFIWKLELGNWKFQRVALGVGKRSIRAEASCVSRRGVYGSENAGTSNRNAGEIPAHRKSKVSWAMVIIPGLVGPKVRPKGVVDGHTVNIP